MENNDFFSQLQQFATQEDLIGLGREIGALRTAFEDFILEEERQDQVKQLETREKGEAYEPRDFKADKESFYALFKNIQETRKKQIDQKNALENENLRLKKEVIQQLKDVVEKEENIGTAFNKQKELLEAWKNIGQIPREKRDEIQREFSRLMELFFYNINIYRELKEHDYKRNQQLKEDVIFKLKSLRASHQNVRDLEAHLRTLQDEWESIGPVKNEDWETLKTSYWEVARSIYDKINHHYDEQRAQLLENIQKKKALIEKATTVVSDLEALKKSKDWDEKTTEVLALQEEWKSIGAGPKKENEAVWTEFRAICDTFFEAKKNFTRTIDAQFKENGQLKRALIDAAKELQGSTDWKVTADKIIQLQKKWKTIGNAGQRFENKLWAEFRGACDAFFTARDNHFSAQDAELIQNLEAKNELIATIENATLPEEKSEALKQLKVWNDAFSAIGHVPMRQKNDVYEKFKRAIDKQYSNLKLEANEKEAVLFQARLETLQSSPERSKLLQSERNEIRKQIDTLNKEILQLENNLGFFSRSKGADQLRKEVEQKVERTKSKILSLKNKLKLIPNE